MDLRSIFLRHLPAARALHTDLKEQLNAIQSAYSAQMLYPGKLTLLEIILAGSRLKLFDSPVVFAGYRDSVIEAMKRGDEKLPQVSHLKAFRTPDIKTLQAGYTFLKNLQNSSYWDAINSREPMKWYKLTQLSARAKAPTTLLSIKYYWLHCDYDTDHSFDGVLANTTPIRNSLKLLFGTDFDSALTSTMQQQRLAGEINHPGLDAFMLNTVLWVMSEGYEYEE